MNTRAAARKAALELGLEADEYQRIEESLARPPNFTELAVFSAMWSEHCSYKSSRRLLSRLPTEGAQVICGPGENAGVVDIGDGQAAVFKMESHNHPSFIEPYHGAATGIGGVMRDIFTMGARPMANLNALRFGAPTHAKTRHLLGGVVSGLGDYGNCVGVPMLGGATGFDAGYDDNILVNAMCVGIAERDRIFYAKAGAPGNPVFYVGSKTGRDGIHGASMASASFEEESASKRPTVQVGDPFAEKLLLEACLELMSAEEDGAPCIVGIQDMGAAGLTSSAVEIAGKGGVGIRLNLDLVPCREPGMAAWEILLSESQERMLVILKPGSEARAREIFAKWQLDCIAIGAITDSGFLEIEQGGERQAHLPIPLLMQPPSGGGRASETTEPVASASPNPKPLPAPKQPIGEILLSMLNSPLLGSRRWIWEQYDSTVMGDTIRSPGAAAGVARIHGTRKALAIGVDVTPRYVAADPYEGAKQAVAASWRSMIAAGARPLAITNCLNFGNPKNAEVMAQFAAVIEGMRAACLALDYPVVSGNVSFYNETRGRGIPPTPSIGGIGLLDDLALLPQDGFTTPGDSIVLLGENRGHLAHSLYALTLDEQASEGAAPPPVDLEAEKRAGLFVLEQIRRRRIRAVASLAGGGLASGLARMCLRGGEGAVLTAQETNGPPPHAWLFGEDQARFLLACAPETAETLLRQAASAGIPATRIGTVGGNRLAWEAADLSLPLPDMRAACEAWLPRYMDPEK